MSIQITAIYAALLGVMMIVLRTQVSILRGKTGISIMHGDNMNLAESMRRHGNFIENVPMALILMAFAETMAAPAMMVHAMGVALIAGRVIHVTGIDHTRPAAPARIIGGILSTLPILAAIGFIAWKTFTA